MKSSLELGLIAGTAVLAAFGNWIADGRPSADPVERLEQVPVGEGEIALGDAPRPGSEGVVWIDARREDQWRADGLPGSIHLTILSDVPLEDQILSHGEQLMTARRIIVYCDDLNCGLSHDLVEQLQEKAEGILAPDAELRVLHGGMTALRSGGWITESTPGP